MVRVDISGIDDHQQGEITQSPYASSLEDEQGLPVVTIRSPSRCMRAKQNPRRGMMADGGSLRMDGLRLGG
jgi:hypothetical protein